MQYDIFIAYKSEDRETANLLKDIFEARDWRVFIDTNINAGTHFSVELEQALDASRTIVVLWSATAKASHYVLDEATEGRDRNALFPVLIEQIKIPYGFRQIQTADLIDWNGDAAHLGCDDLLNALHDHLSSDAPVSASPISKPKIVSPGSVYRDPLRDGGEGPAMVIIPAGRFLMGSPEGEGRDNEHPQHEVTIAQPFAMGQTAVSFTDYDRFCEATSHPHVDDEWGRDEQPVINVSWHDSVTYCQWLSEQTGKNYQLPSEARWEYACRAGTTTPYHTGNKLTHKQANFERKNNGPVPVDKYEPNNFGLYQMHGNVLEWCKDAWYGDYNGAPVDGSARSSGETAARALRGGSWFNNNHACRSSNRYFDPGAPDSSIGFRLSCLPPI